MIHSTSFYYFYYEWKKNNKNIRWTKLERIYLSVCKFCLYIVTPLLVTKEKSKYNGFRWNFVYSVYYSFLYYSQNSSYWIQQLVEIYDKIRSSWIRGNILWVFFGITVLAFDKVWLLGLIRKLERQFFVWEAHKAELNIIWLICNEIKSNIERIFIYKQDILTVCWGTPWSGTWSIPISVLYQCPY